MIVEGRGGGEGRGGEGRGGEGRGGEGRGGEGRGGEGRGGERRGGGGAGKCLLETFFAQLPLVMKVRETVVTLLEEHRHQSSHTPMQCLQQTLTRSPC